MATSSSTALLPFSGAASARNPRLYCFSYAGGSSSIFASWGRELASECAVFGVDLPGHGSRIEDTLLESIQTMAAAAAKVIQTAESSPEKPAGQFMFYGHSLGAIVAYETARLLDDRSCESLTHLFVGAARAPGLPSSIPAISHLDDVEFLDAIHKRYGGLPAILFEEPELRAMVLPILRADFHAYETYQMKPGVKLTLPVTAFFGEKDGVVTASSMNAWEHSSSGSFHLHAIAGGHFFLNESRSQLLRCIRSALKAPFLPSTSRSTNTVPG